MAAKTYQEIARAADAVRVAVWRDKQVWKSEVEALHEGNWWVLLDTGAVINANADGDCAGVVLTFPGGERVTIGDPAPAASERAALDHTAVMLEGERQIEALRASARCAAAASVREEPAHAPAVRVGDVVRVRGIHGPAWVVERALDDEGEPGALCLRFGPDGGAVREMFPLAVLERHADTPPIVEVEEDPIIADSAFQMLAEWWGILEAAVEGEAIPTHRGITTREAVEFLYGPLRRGDPKWDRFREAFESLDGGGQGIPDPRRIGAALRRYRGRSAANGYRIAMKMDHGACRWTADSGVSP